MDFLISIASSIFLTKGKFSANINIGSNFAAGVRNSLMSYISVRLWVLRFYRTLVNLALLLVFATYYLESIGILLGCDVTENNLLLCLHLNSIVEWHSSDVFNLLIYALMFESICCILTFQLYVWSTKLCCRPKKITWCCRRLSLSRDELCGQNDFFFLHFL